MEGSEEANQDIHGTPSPPVMFERLRETMTIRKYLVLGSVTLFVGYLIGHNNGYTKFHLGSANFMGIAHPGGELVSGRVFGWGADQQEIGTCLLKWQKHEK